MGFYIGTSGWAYPSWKPAFYPAKLPARKFLEFYATQLNSVEVNFTFRQLPSEAMLLGWLAATGEDFAFSFKASQRITHFARLKSCEQLVDGFYASLNPVQRAGRLGVILFQLPPNLKADAVLLDGFLAHAGRPGVRLAFEFRHASWFAEGFAEETYATLKRHQAALCVAESDALESPDVATAPFRCYRLRKSEYSPAELDGINAQMRERAQGGDVFVYFKHEETPEGALNAVNTLRGLSER
jgi:uncharacterized protein YecE (DUF72 family)